MKFFRIAVGAATVLVQAVLPRCAEAGQAGLGTSKSTPLKESPDPTKVLGAAIVPEVESSLVGDRKLLATDILRAGGISGTVEPGPSSPRLVANRATSRDLSSAATLDWHITPPVRMSCTQFCTNAGGSCNLAGIQALNNDYDKLEFVMSSLNRACAFDNPGFRVSASDPSIHSGNSQCTFPSQVSLTTCEAEGFDRICCCGSRCATSATPITTTTSTTTTTTTTTTTPKPTSAPSSSPVIPPPGPYQIVYQDFSSSLADSTLEIETEFLIGKARDYETDLLDKNCQEPITGINMSTTEIDTPHNLTYDHLSVQRDVDVSSIANSSAWNGTSNELEVCQIVRLFLPASDTHGKLDLAEDTRLIKIGFDLDVDFNITVDLTEATISNDTATVDVQSYLQAYQCILDDPYVLDLTPIAPGDELSVCLHSLAPNEVRVEELISMEADQDGTILPIVEDGVPVIPSITVISFYEPDLIMVTTRLPINTFQFANGQSVMIQGQVEMELANGGTRKLRVLVDGGIEGNEKASYDLEVNLQEVDGVADDGVFTKGNSAIATVALDKVFAFAAALVFVFAA